MKVHFVFFDKSNFASIRALVERCIAHPELEPVAIKAFDYREIVGEIGPRAPIDGLEELRLDGGRGPADVAQFKDGFASSREDARGRLADELQAWIFDQPYMPVLLEHFDALKRNLEAFVARERPRLVILPEDTDFMRGRLAVSVLRAADVETIVVWPTYCATIVRYPLLGAGMCDAYFVPNEDARARLVARGVDSEAVVVTGSPFFDGMSSARSRPERPLFVYVLQKIEWERIIVRDLVRIFDARPDVDFAIKVHPDARGGDESGFIPTRVRVIRHRTMRDVLAETTCVIGQSSIALYEAVACGVDAIFVAYGSFPPEIGLPEAAQERVATDPDALARLIDASARGGLAPLPIEPFVHDASSATDTIFQQILSRLGR